MISRRRFLTLSAFAVGAGLIAHRRRKVEWQGVAMGADVSITLSGTTESDAAAALTAAYATIRRMEQLFSLYDPMSEISRLNADQARQLPAAFIDLIEAADHAYRVTGGLFDPTVQPVFAARLNGRKPGAGTQANVGWNHVEFDRHSVRFQRHAMAITLNGIAQGFATDTVRDVLLGYGFDRALVNIGEYRAGSQSAHIGVSGADGGIIAIEDIRQAAIATSSAKGFTFADGSSHILDPFDFGRPQWAGATVIASSAANADAFSTALILAKGQNLAQSLVDSGEAKSVLLEDFSGNLFRV